MTATRAYVTGGTGFIGRRLVAVLLENGVDVTCLVRSSSKAKDLQSLGVRLVEGDITDRPTVRDTIEGHQLVFHLAGWFQLGVPKDREPDMRAVNVTGTRNVLEEAWKSGAQRIVHCSTVGALGSSGSPDNLATEDQVHDGRFQSLYVKTKHEAHKVAEQLIADGAPIIMVLPEAVYGPGDRNMVSRQIALTLRGLMTAIPRASGIYCYTHIDDAAQGIWLAAQKGRIGQAYILAGPPVTLEQFYEAVARHANVPPPRGRLSPRLLRSIVRLGEWFPFTTRLSRGRPLDREAIAMITEANWAFSSRKAEMELGWTGRSLEEGLPETVQWVRSNELPILAA